ncbi:MAG: hypothetical protein KatS3mg014_1421 [Actinomycetota bacterium]|nr:MAG: hypothetical protein KatS3mg014_1421 [Actinomycetota bacterium]
MRFMVMYHVRSPEFVFRLSFRSGLVRYCCRMAAGGAPWAMSISPFSTRL